MPQVFKRAELAGLRRWRVRDFEILRVLYANQDWWRALGVEVQGS